MENIISKYNVEIEYDNGILLYNSLTDKLLPINYPDYAVIETLMEHIPEFERQYPDLFQAFQNSGFIIPSDFDELAYIRLQNKRCVFINKDYHITINPTLDCNLKCWYCSVDYAGTQHQKERMSDETIDSLKKHIENLVFQQKANSVSLDWFGGEPLMYFDEVISKVSEYAKRVTAENNVNFRQQITTNATLLNESRIKQMKEMNFDFFQIAIDGNEKRHNQIKFYVDKHGSYRDVVNNINLIAEIIPNINIALRINYDKQTLKKIVDILPDFSEKSKCRIMVDFQKVWQINISEKDKELLEEVKESFKSSGLIPRLGSYLPFSYKSCYADSINHYVINYNAKVFKCTARDYGEKLVIGELRSSGDIIWREGILSKMFEKATFENQRCESCKMLPLCMGPCIQKNYDSRVNSQPLQCTHENINASLSSYVKGKAKQRNLI
jgi:uncharacterized protein